MNWLHGFLTFSLHAYHPSLPVSPSKYILCQHRADVNKLLWVATNWKRQNITLEQHRESICSFLGNTFVIVPTFVWDIYKINITFCGDLKALKLRSQTQDRKRVNTSWGEARRTKSEIQSSATWFLATYNVNLQTADYHHLLFIKINMHIIVSWIWDLV